MSDGIWAINMESITRERAEHLADMIGSIELYILQGCPTGGFLEAVLSNDLKECMARADDVSRHIVFEIVCHLYQNCPGGCWGSPRHYRDWLAMDPDDRLRLVAASKFGRDRGVLPPPPKGKEDDHTPED